MQQESIHRIFSCCSSALSLSLSRPSWACYRKNKLQEMKINSSLIKLAQAKISFFFSRIDHRESFHDQSRSLRIFFFYYYSHNIWWKFVRLFSPSRDRMKSNKRQYPSNYSLKFIKQYPDKNDVVLSTRRGRRSLVDWFISI